VSERAAIGSLARAHGLERTFTDIAGRRRTASLESQLAVLRALGAPIERPADAAAALRDREAALGRRLLDPVRVAWEGGEQRLALRLPGSDLPRRVACRVALENGTTLEQRCGAATLRGTRRSVDADGRRSIRCFLPLASPLPLGYHRVALEAGPLSAECRLIVAPRRAFAAPRAGERDFGLFLPLHALRAADGWGTGSYTDLAQLVRWTAEQGGRWLGTLPLGATFLDAPFEPSPYRPASRLLWSELHVTVGDLPAGLELPRAARAVLESSGFRHARARLRAASQVDPRAQIELLRAVLEPLARRLGSRSLWPDGLRRHLRRHPEAAAYARFRATMEALGRSWERWPARLRDGRLRGDDCDPVAETYHALVQWIAAHQLEQAGRQAHERDVRLCLDLPLGVHPQGYDVWRYPKLFARGASVGAPPDACFTLGQDWSFPPLHPEACRADGHSYFAACLRHHMRAAGMLRIDHVMSLRRLFWIPRGHDARDGVYVRYPAEELHAVVCLESWRQRCALVGEDLGLVPDGVRSAMRRHGLRRTCIVQFSQPPDGRRPLESLRLEGLASLRTHDLPAFAAFWRGLDIGERRRLGLLTANQARRERRGRERVKRAWLRDLRCGGRLAAGPARTADVFRACLSLMCDSRANTVVVDLEDLWGETRSHNVPGTTTERPNWRRKARHSLATFARLPRVLGALAELRRRRGAWSAT